MAKMKMRSQSRAQGRADAATNSPKGTTLKDFQKMMKTSLRREFRARANKI